MEPDNIERYDRQIRLWGQHGQNKCSSSKICLIDANSLGTEILKDLCLAGIGSYVIIDSHKLTPEDVGCNFISSSSVGKNRGETVKQMMSTYNEDVGGEVLPLETYLPHITSSTTKPESDTYDELDSKNGFWSQFNCVIVCGFLNTDQIIRLSRICWNLHVPLIVCKSIGYYGYMRSQLREHLIIESHPDTPLPDFCLDHPFEDLKQYFDSIDLDDVSNIEQAGRYPYVVIVYKYLKMWQSQYGHPSDRLPNSYAEKKQLKELIDVGMKQMIKRRREVRGDDVSASDTIPYENYLEATKAINTCFSNSNRVPELVESIFQDQKVTSNSAQQSSRFWLIIKAVKDFVYNNNNGRLPISGSIPDMISSSDEYIRLQRIYSKKARDDVESVLALVPNLNPLPVSATNPSNTLFEEIKLICKNIRDLQMLSTAAIFNDYKQKNRSPKDEDDGDDFKTIGLCLMASDLFFSIYSRLPGYQDDQVEVDISKLKDCVRQIVGKVPTNLKTLDQCLYEICRCGGAEFHVTSAFMGGCVAQEVIKIVTNQYAPVNDTLVYNAMNILTQSFKSSEIFNEI